MNKFRTSMMKKILSSGAIVGTTCLLYQPKIDMQYNANKTYLSSLITDPFFGVKCMKKTIPFFGPVLYADEIAPKKQPYLTGSEFNAKYKDVIFYRFTNENENHHEFQ